MALATGVTVVLGTRLMERADPRVHRTIVGVDPHSRERGRLACRMAAGTAALPGQHHDPVAHP